MTNKKENILVIDDSNTNVVLVEAILNSKGYQITTAMSVKEALPIIDNQTPKLILLDLLMPQISGYQFLEDLKKNDNTKDIPVIIVSAVTDKESRIKTKKLGAVDYIEKPIDITALLNKVEEILN
jgi:DNA-binding response OmpR family regulator